METIAPILARKQPHFYYILSGCSLRDALNKMNCENSIYLTVVDEDENFLGLLTEHEITTNIMFGKKPAEKILVDELMNKNLPVASSDDTVERCIKLMCQHHIHQIPVFDDYEFKGIICADDLLQEVAVMRNEVFDDDREVAIY
jgi:predicted transcriptional regulator